MPVPPRIAPDHQSAFLTHDDLHLYVQAWDPTAEGTEETHAEVRGTVLIVHGYGEHSGRYGHVARAFTEAGLQVFAYDQRGYGRSEGPRAYVRSFDAYLDDLDRVLRTIRPRAREHAPLFLFGHSMGGAVVLLHALERSASLTRHGVKGLMLSSPAIEVDPDIAPLLRKAARVIGAFAPWLPVAQSPEGMISRDPDVVREAETDPLNYHGRVQARLGAELLRACQRVQARQHELEIPFLVFHGTDDAITSPDASRRLYDAARSDDKALQLYDGLYHETFNEPERDRVLADLQQWVTERLPA